MKYLLVFAVVGLVLWMMLSRARGRGADDAAAPPDPATPKPPALMVQCAHCGLHLAAADAQAEGSRLYCSDDHRRLGPDERPH